MSEPILPLRQWPAGIQQASVPANDNALRVEAMERPCLGFANDASGTDADGDLWIVDSAPTGAFSGFDPNDLALYHVDPDTSIPGWYPWAPTDGLRLIVADVPMIYVGGSTNEWQEDTSDGISDAPSDGSIYGRKDGAWEVVAGTGDVTGPASSTDGNLVLFDGTTGKLLKDGGALGDMAGIDDAPSDGTGYVRKDGAWAAEAANRNIVTTVSSSSGTTALDASLGDYFKSSLTENTTIALSNVPAGCTLHLQLTQHASTGPYTAAFPSGWDWGEGNTAPTMPTGAGKIMDVIVTSNDSGATGIASWRVRA